MPNENSFSFNKYVNYMQRRLNKVDNLIHNLSLQLIKIACQQCYCIILWWILMSWSFARDYKAAAVKVEWAACAVVNIVLTGDMSHIEQFHYLYWHIVNYNICYILPRVDNWSIIVVYSFWNCLGQSKVNNQFIHTEIKSPSNGT